MQAPCDIAVIGAGAAGLMTAISAGREDRPVPRALKIVLFDSRPKVGAKILMSGGTRCNVTNREVTPSDYQGGPRHFVKHVLEAFTPQQTIGFFEQIGVSLALEPTGKYFPTTHSGKTVLEALLKEAHRVGTVLTSGVKIQAIKKTGDLFYLKAKGASNPARHFEICARRVVLTTGGLSYPETGSDGTGLEIVKSFGHTIVPTNPALTPLLTDVEDWKSLSGVSLEAELSFFEAGKKKARSRGAFLFTHFGFSGPAPLDLSRHWAGAGPGRDPKIFVNFLPHETVATLNKKFENIRQKNPTRQIKGILSEDFLLPRRFVEVFLSRCTQLKSRNPCELILNYPLEVSGVYGYKKAEVTAGGVDLREVSVSTMESKIVPGLYFSGEILDVDGRIGGFNFQWAWSTGWIAGRSAAKSVE